MKMFNITLIIFNLQILQILAFNFSPKIWNLNVVNVNKTIEEAIQEYFETKTCVLSVTVHLEYLRIWEFLIDDYISDVFKGTESMKFEIFNNKYKKQKLASKHNLWYVDSYKAFSSLMPIVDGLSVEKLGQYMVILETAKHLRHERELQLIFELAFQRNIVDIVVARYVKNSTFNLYTYDLFQPQQCRLAVPRHFNTFHNGRFASEELFPHKLRNFHRCRIHVFVRLAFPFFNYTFAEDGNEIDKYWGLEAIILRTIADELNFDMRIEGRGAKVIGTVFDNGTVTGIFRALSQSRIDIIVGYYHYPSRSRYFAPSISYFMTPLVVVIARRHHAIATEWMWLMEPYGKRVWLMIFLTMAFGMVIANCVHWKRLHTRRRFVVYVTWLDMFGMALGNSRVCRFRHFGMKYSFFLWIFGFMIVCNTFHGKLYEAFNSIPVSSPISIAQLIEANYTFVIKNSVGPELLAALQIPSKQLIYNDYTDDSEVYEKMLRDAHPRAILTNYWEFQAFVKARRLYDDYVIVPRIVVINQVCAYMRPQSYLVEPLNRLLNALHTGGILKKWMFDIAGRFGTPNDIEKAWTRNSVPEPKPLSMAKVRIIFVGLLAMHAVSFVVFLGEILVKKISNKFAHKC